MTTTKLISELDTRVLQYLLHSDSVCKEIPCDSCKNFVNLTCNLSLLFDIQEKHDMSFYIREEFKNTHLPFLKANHPELLI